ncbi:MAG: IclR family transcriptional regulator [Alphaproteobacteria bacterium]|nr:IclR family transcriptional regulator [Alphaproteobacteria bacterium]
MLNTEVRSAVRVLELLEYLARCPEAVALKDVVANLQLPKSSAHALLRTLVSRGYVERDDNERYALVAAFRDGGGWIGGHDAQIAAVARPVMEELRDGLRETIFLGARGPGGDVKTLAKLVSPETIRYDSDGTRPGPAYCTAMGRTLLAFGDPDQAEAYLARTKLVALTPRTITDPARLRAILRRVRSDGYCVVVDEMVLGGTGTSAPIFAADGRCIAVLNVAIVTARFPKARERIIAEAKRGAALIGQRLGHRGDAEAA